MKDALHFPLAEMGEALLEQLREEQWEQAAISSSSYLAAVRQLMSAYQQDAIPAEKQAMAEQLQALRASQAEIVARLRARMVQLEQNMVRLQRGKAGCRDYAAQIPHRFG